MVVRQAKEVGGGGNAFWSGESGRIRHQGRAGTDWADRVITVSRALQHEAQWMYEIPDWKVSVVYNGVNVHNYDGWIEPGEVKRRYSIGPLDPTVLFVGRLVYQKGPALLIGAIPSILQYYPRTKFIL